MKRCRIAKIKPDPEHEGKYIRIDFYYTPSWQIAQTRENDNLDDKETVATARKYEYVWDIRYIDAPVCRDENKNADNDCTDAATGIQGANEGDEHLYYCNDANMNVTAILDGYDGAVVERYAYDPYGKPTVLNGVRDSTGAATTEWNARTSNTFQNAILYCGYFFDDESGLYHVRNRYYHPTLGRWMTRDVLFDLQLQEYCRSAPVDLRDATGLRPDIVMPAEFSVYAGLGFSIHAEYRGHAEDCCDSYGRLIKDGKQSDSVSASVSVGFGVGVEGKIGPISIGIVLKGPQVEVSGEARTPDAPCGEIPEGVTVVSTAELFMGVGMEAGVIVVGGSAESCHGENPAYYNISLILTANPDGGHVELKVSRGQRTKCACNVGPCEWTETKDDSPPSRTLWEHTFSAPR